MLFSRKSLYALLVGLTMVAVTGTPARAIGTMTIAHQDGDVDKYDDVEVKVLSGSLFLTSDDGDGTIVINKAACAYQGKIIVCLPTSAVLVQDGEAGPLDITTGTIYLNYTDEAQPLSRSSAKLPAHSVMVAFSTKKGTSVSATGTIDQLIRQ